MQFSKLLKILNIYIFLILILYMAFQNGNIIKILYYLKLSSLMFTRVFSLCIKICKKTSTIKKILYFLLQNNKQQTGFLVLKFGKVKLIKVRVYIMYGILKTYNYRQKYFNKSTSFYFLSKFSLKF